MSDPVASSPSLPPLADELRASFYVSDAEHEPIVQASSWTGHRTRIQPSVVTVNAFGTLGNGPRFYVSITGPIVRLSDGKRSRTDSAVAFWWEHEHADHRLENAPAWLQVLANDARTRMLRALA